MNISWSKSQKKHARELFDLALSREYEELIKRVNSTKVKTPEEVWALHDMLGKKRKAMSEKYDYRYSRLIFVFMRLVNEGYLTIEELNPIGEEKVDLISGIIGIE